jgi:carbohydrate-binding DOMON domain-containing protein
MSSQQKHHEELVDGLYNQLKEIFDSSDQAIYLYLDDTHKVCNKKFAGLLGFSSPEEWAKIENPLEANVDTTSQKKVVSAYRDAMEKSVASRIEVKLKKKDGVLLNAFVIMVPITFRGHYFALHFISQTK